MSKLGKVKGFKKFMHLASCLGASIVIVGALFKIMHWPGASVALICGLGTEAVLFILFGVDIPHEEVDWTLAYPELAGMGHTELPEHEHEEGQMSVTAQLDNLLADAKIGPELIESLGSSIRNLTDTTGKMSDISAATSATSEYVENVKHASQNVSKLSESYSKAAESISTLADTNDSTTSIGESLTKVSKNLSALNATYELELQRGQTHLESTSKFYEGLADLMKNLHDSADDTKKYRQEMATLATNLSSLNTIYGNMLSAMNQR